MTTQTLQIEWKTKAQLEAIATYLYSLGYRYSSHSIDRFCKEWGDDKFYWIVLYPQVKGLGGNLREVSSHKTITLQELFDLEQPQSITVKLDDYFSAIVCKDDVLLKNSSMTIQLCHSAIKELAAACEKMKGQQ